MTLDEFVKECESLREDFKWSNEGRIIRGLRKGHNYSYCPLTAMCYKKCNRDLANSLYPTAAHLLYIELHDAKTIVRTADDYNRLDYHKQLYDQLCTALGITK